MFNLKQRFLLVEFPSFQIIVLQEKLPKLVTEICTSDNQSTVRASALKCLQEMIVVPVFWFQALDNVEILVILAFIKRFATTQFTLHFLQKKLQYILNEEIEAIVRSEAVGLLVKIYRYHSFPEEMKEQMYELMSYSATIDLHWEVKIKALEFWDAVIEERLKHQGKIDGSFPSVTFSKENRKIVTLTDTEVQKRLNKALLQLSNCGCLGVLMSAIQDDCDIEVVKQAVDITKKLLELTKKYKVCSLSCKTYERSLSTTSSTSNGDSIEPMLLGNDETTSNLSTCRNDSVKSTEASPTSDMVLFTRRNSVKIISPTDFMSFVQQDLDELVNARKKWLDGVDSFNSVLDDVLKNCDEGHQCVKNMDCY